MSTIKTKQFIPLPDRIFVTDLEHGFQRSVGGIIIPDDNKKDHGIRPRWGKVAYVGSKVDYVNVNQYVLMLHGRWSHKFTLEFEDNTTLDLWQIDPKDILLVSDEMPKDRVNIEVVKTNV